MGMFSWFTKKTKVETPTDGTFSLPTTYAAINLGQYVRWHMAKTPTEKCAAALNRSVSEVRKLNASSINRINAVFEKVVETELTTSVGACRLNGNEYGFIPNIDALPIGQYIDLDEQSKAVFTQGDYTKLIDMMSVCYRPITSRIGGKYTIADYTGMESTTNRDDLEQLPMSVVSGAMLFFSTFEVELLTSSLDFLTNVAMEMQMDLQSTSTNGGGSTS